jgi:hypothetical protein
MPHKALNYSYDFLRVSKIIYGWLTIREELQNWAIDAASYPGIIYRVCEHPWWTYPLHGIESK